MVNNKKDNNTVEDTIIEELEETTQDQEVESTEEVVEQLPTIETLTHDKLKLLADIENISKRHANERVDLIKYSPANLLNDLLPTLDLFEQALNAKQASDEVKNWLIGFEMILKNFKTTLENNGVKEVQAKSGDTFDAKLHFAIEEVESTEVKPGLIVNIKTKGYKLHDRLLRPTMVTVAKQADKTTNEKEINEKEKN